MATDRFNVFCFLVYFRKYILKHCSSTAYLLFYERKSFDYHCQMPNVEAKNQVADEFSLTGDDRLWCSLM